MWDKIADIQPVRPASLATPPVPRLRGAVVGPLAGSGGASALRGGAAADTLAPAPAVEDAGPPIPRLRPGGTAVDRKPLVKINPGVRDFAEDLATGWASGDPSAPPLAAFGTSFAGAISADRSREAEEAAAAARADDRAYERGRDAAADARAAAADTRAERELDAKIKGEGYYAKPDSTTKYVDEEGNITAEGVKEIYGFVNDEVDSLRDFYQQSGLIRRSNAAEIEKKIADYALKYRKELEDAIRAGKSPFEVRRPVDEAAAAEIAGSPGSPGAPEPAAPAAAPAAPAPAKPGGEAVATPPAGYTGNGTPESPYAGGSGPPPGMKPGQVWTDGTYLYETE